MKFSEITVEHIKEYLNAYDEDLKLLELILKGAKSYVNGYTGLSEECLDKYEDITIAVMVLCNDMFENRLYSTEIKNKNVIVSSILDMHSVNML